VAVVAGPAAAIAAVVVAAGGISNR
jgi:hypothetical protein